MWDIPARVDAGGRAFQGAQRAPWGDQGAALSPSPSAIQQSFTGEIKAQYSAGIHVELTI